MGLDANWGIKNLMLKCFWSFLREFFPIIIVPEVWVGNRMTLANGWLGRIPHLKFNS